MGAGGAVKKGKGPARKWDKHRREIQHAGEREKDRTAEMNSHDAFSRGHRGMRPLGVRKNRFGETEDEKKRKAIKHQNYLANDKIKKKRAEKAKRQKRQRT